MNLLSWPLSRLILAPRGPCKYFASNHRPHLIHPRSPARSLDLGLKGAGPFQQGLWVRWYSLYYICLLAFWFRPLGACVEIDWLWGFFRKRCSSPSHPAFALPLIIRRPTRSKWATLIRRPTVKLLRWEWMGSPLIIVENFQWVSAAW